MPHRRLRSVLYLAVGVMLLAAFVPLPTDGDLGDPAEGINCRHKLAQLWQAAQSGSSGRMGFTEREINAHLASVMEANPGVREARGLTVGVEDLRLAIVEDEACLFVIGRALFLPFVLEYRATTTREAHDGVVRLESVRLGRLPLVQPLEWIATGHLDQLTRGLRAEREILQHLTALEVTEGKILLAVG